MRITTKMAHKEFTKPKKSILLLTIPIALTCFLQAPLLSADGNSETVSDAEVVQSNTRLPKRKIRRGTKTLTCVSVKFEGGKNNQTKNCLSLAKSVANFYKRNSNGRLKLIPRAATVKVPFPGSSKNINKANAFLKRKVKSDLYIVPISFRKGNAHAGSRIAHVKGKRVGTAVHEVGHLLGLGHAGAYKFGKGKSRLDQYGDGLSAMSGFPSNFLTAPQYYYNGWLPLSQVEGYEAEFGTRVYTLEALNKFSSDELKAVYVMPKTWGNPGGRPAWISYPRWNKGGRNVPTLHLQNGGGSQKIKMFGSEYHDTRFTGLHITVLEKTESTLTIAVDYRGK